MTTREPSKPLAAAEAARLWRLYGWASVADLVLEDLAFALGVHVLEGRLDSADARLIRRGNHGLIRVKEGIPESGRKRFAVAHELGHWLLHKTASQILACTSEDMVAQYKASAEEVEANCFAAELLMPEKLFAGLCQVSKPSRKLISELASRFQTTLTATAVRFVELSDDYCAVVVSEAGKVRWWRASPRLEDRCRIAPGASLHPDTVVADYFNGGEVPGGAQAVDAEAWLGGQTDLEEPTVCEEAIPLERYGQVVSLLWLP